MNTRMTRRAGLAAALAVGAGYAGMFHLGRTWGATAAERHRVLPGNDLVAGPKLRTTHAITVAASPDEVWPWLLQMGWGRAGWYTYRWVDLMLFPANEPSADRILPEYQHLDVGDHIPDGPPATNCFFTVRRLEPAKLLVLHSDSHLFGAPGERDDVTMDWVWTWQLSQADRGHTRIAQRNNGRLTPRWLHMAYLATIVPADFVMARSHLQGIKRRVEHRTASAA